MPPSPSHDRAVPVFVSPNTLTFVTEDHTSHKQVLTLYNPYDFKFRYKVLCTAPGKYTVTDSEGTVRPKRFVDIVIRHNEISPINERITDKFRIQIYDLSRGQGTVCAGLRDISSTLLPRRERTPSVDERFESLPKQTSGTGDLPTSPSSRHTFEGDRQKPGLLVWLVMVLCGTCLLLPSTGSPNPSLPNYVHLSETQKLVASFLLGMTFMVFIKQL